MKNALGCRLPHFKSQKKAENYSPNLTNIICLMCLLLYMSDTTWLLMWKLQVSLVLHNYKLISEMHLSILV